LQRAVSKTQLHFVLLTPPTLSNFRPLSATFYK